MRIDKLFKNFILFVALFTGGIAHGKDPEDPSKNAAVANDLAILALSSNTLAFQLYDLIQADEKNIIFSPYSLSIALGMIYSGADGSTQSQMARVLGFPLHKEALSRSFALLTRILSTDFKKWGEEFVFNVANGLWVQRGQAVLPAFSKNIVDNYKGIVKTVDFAFDPDRARVDINNWVDERTQGKIKTLFAPEELSASSRMVLVSAIYMRGKWQMPFNENFTRQTPFFPNASTTMTVPMMTVTAAFPFLSEEHFALLELPYDMQKSKEGNVGLFILLPKDTYGLSGIHERLNATALRGWMEQMKPQKVTVSLPKFKVSSGIAFERLFVKLGMVAPFSDEADFSKIDGAHDLKLSAIMQKSYLSVDEKGSEAAASTGISVVGKSLDVTSPQLFVVDHPFLFFVVDKASGVILFMGKISHPDLK